MGLTVKLGTPALYISRLIDLPTPVTSWSFPSAYPRRPQYIVLTCTRLEMVHFPRASSIADESTLGSRIFNQFQDPSALSPLDLPSTPASSVYPMIHTDCTDN